MRLLQHIIMNLETYLSIDFMDGVTEEDYIRYAYMMATKLSKSKELEE